MAQTIFIAVFASVLLACWYRYSIEKGWRRLAELYLWLGPIVPLSLAEVHKAGGLNAVVPAGILHVGLIGLALRAVTALASAAAAMPRLAGGLLILGSTVVWLGATTFPGMRLDLVASHQANHWITNGAFLIGALITLAGFTVLATLLRTAGERVLSQLGSVAFLVGVVTWVIHLAFRVTVTVSAAKELTSSGTLPAWYPPLRLWSGVMYGIYLTLAYLATAAYGGAMLKTGWAGKGWGRTIVIFSLVSAVGFLGRTGSNDPPLMVQLMPYTMGMLLLRRAAAGQPGVATGSPADVFASPQG